MNPIRPKVEYFVAVASFFAAVALAFTSVVITPDHDVASGTLMMCAQFLMLTATIFGLDYHIIQRINQLSHKKSAEDSLSK